MSKATKSKTKAGLHVTIDSDLKEEAGKVIKDMGLTYASAVTLFFRNIVNTRKLPFEPEASGTLDRALQEVADGDVDKFDSVEDWKKYIEKYVRS